MDTSNTEIAAANNSRERSQLPDLTIVNSQSVGQRTVTDIGKLVNFAIGKVSKKWGLTPDEVEDMSQDAWVAALTADRTYKPDKGKWSTWLLRRIQGQLIDSIARLRNAGVAVAHDTREVVYTDDIATKEEPTEAEFVWDEGSDDHMNDEDQQQISPERSLDELVDISIALERLEQCLPERSLKILRRYYGLDGDPTGTISDLSRWLGLGTRHTFNLLQTALSEARYCLD